ncbi:MAG: hypothetical protein PHN57_08510, partial [Candidatus Omnitrophica bacterium]|nr:hypothetical protein [Candidatus Omnitrophota bacterium]
QGKTEGLFKPYIIKELGGIKVGVIGLTTPYATQKTQNYKFVEPLPAVQDAVSKLKKQGVQVIVLLSHLGENDDMKLLKVVPEINIIISGHSRSKEEPSSKVGNTIILRPTWQGRRLGKLTLSMEGARIADYKTEDIRLSDNIKDDPEILAILPHCFSDLNCKKGGLSGVCQNPGSMQAQCIFNQAAKVPLTIITVKNCIACDSTKVVTYLKRQFPGLAVSYLYYPAQASEKMVKEYAIEGLPAYLLGKEAEREKAFGDLKENLEKKKDIYLLKPTFSGVAYFLDRKKINGKLDLFFSLFDKGTIELLAAIKDFNPQVHFLTSEENGRFAAPGGQLELEEDARCVCVQKYYPQVFWDYLSCRAGNIHSSWWDECLPQLDSQKIKDCARSQEGKTLLQENAALNKELKVMLGPTYLIDNKEIFSSQGLPTKEEFKKIFRR